MALPAEKSSADEFAPVGRFQWIAGRYQMKNLFAAGMERLSRADGVAKTSEPVLVEVDSAQRRVYTPLEDHPDLFTLFAGIKEPEDIVPFANSYGYLRLPDPYRGRFVSTTLRRPTAYEFGERIIEWGKEAFAMARSLELWEQINGGDLKSIIVWGKDDVSYFAGDGSESGLVANATYRHASFYHRWKRGDLEGPARLYLASVINLHLQQSVAPQLVFDDSHQFKEYTRPLSLLGAMWYQMCRAFTGEQPVKRCAAPDCGNWMLYERSTKTMHEACALRIRQRRYREAHNVKAETR